MMLATQTHTRTHTYTHDVLGLFTECVVVVFCCVVGAGCKGRE